MIIGGLGFPTTYCNSTGKIGRHISNIWKERNSTTGMNSFRAMLHSINGLGNFFVSKITIVANAYGVITGEILYHPGAGALRATKVAFGQPSKREKSEISLSLSDPSTLNQLGTSIVQFFPQIWEKCKAIFPEFTIIEWPLPCSDTGTRSPLTKSMLDALFRSASKLGWDYVIKNKNSVRVVYKRKEHDITEQQLQANTKFSS